jgi:predicted CoA-binding protein
MVVSPEKGRTLLQPLYDKGIRLLWFQPGAYDKQILDEAVAKGFDIIYDYCVLIELNNAGR